MLLALGSFAQVGGSGSVYDSSVIPAKRMPQQNEFWNKSKPESCRPCTSNAFDHGRKAKDERSVCVELA